MPVIEMIAQAQAKMPIHREAIAHFFFCCLWYLIALHNSFIPKPNTIIWSNLMVLFIMALPLPDDKVKKADAPEKVAPTPHKSSPDRDSL